MLQAIRFILKDKPIFMKIMVIMFAVNVSVISLLLIGILVLITTTLKLDLNMVGISQFFIAIGALLGGILASLLGAKLTIRKCSLLLIILGLLPIPMGLVIIFDVTAILAFVVITVAGTLAMLVNTLILVALQTFFQSETPPEIFGKVIGIIFTLPFLAQAVGQFGLGVIFEEFGNWPWLSIFISVIITVGAALYSINVFRKYK